MKIAIIGGGVSGLSAANRLRKLSSKKGNEKDVTFKIFEARNRLGGRIWTERWSDTKNDGEEKKTTSEEEEGEFFNSETQENDVVELGAIWVLGQFEFENPIMNIIDREGLELFPTQFEDIAIYEEFETSNKTRGAFGDGKNADHKMTVARRVPKKDAKLAYADYLKQDGLLAEFFEESESESDDSDDSSIESEASNDDKKRDKSLEEGIRHLNTLPESSLRRRLTERLWNIHQIIEASSLSSVSLRNWFKRTVCDASDDDENLNLLLDGYSRVVDAMASKVAKEGCIELETIIREIRAVDEDDLGVDLVIESTKTGEFRTERYDAVICTVPLGCLRAHDVQFAPVTDGLKKRGFVPTKEPRMKFGVEVGLINRVVLKFSYPFWQVLRKDQQDRGWADEDDFIGWLAHDSGKNSTDNKKLEIFQYINLHNQCQATLAVDFGGESAKNIEQMSDGDIVEACMEPLRKIYGSRCLEPTRTFVTRWGSDPFSRGAFSTNPIGSSPQGDSNGRLGGIVGDGVWGNRLVFAGEATSTKHPATVWGAYESGKREADFLFTKL